MALAALEDEGALACCNGKQGLRDRWFLQASDKRIVLCRRKDLYREIKTFSLRMRETAAELSKSSWGARYQGLLEADICQPDLAMHYPEGLP